MKSLLWFFLVAALVANPVINLVMEENLLQIVLSVCSGLTVIGSGVGLWLLRDRAEAHGY